MPASWYKEHWREQWQRNHIPVFVSSWHAEAWKAYAPFHDNMCEKQYVARRATPKTHSKKALSADAQKKTISHPNLKRSK